MTNDEWASDYLGVGHWVHYEKGMGSQGRRAKGMGLGAWS